MKALKVKKDIAKKKNSIRGSSKLTLAEQNQRRRERQAVEAELRRKMEDATGISALNLRRYY